MTVILIEQESLAKAPSMVRAQNAWIQQILPFAGSGRAYPKIKREIPTKTKINRPSVEVANNITLQLNSMNTGNLHNKTVKGSMGGLELW